MKSRAAQGFNILQINSLPQYDSVKPTCPFSQPFALNGKGSWDFDKPQDEYFTYLDRMIACANEHGMIAAVVVLWFNYVPNARLWTVPRPRPEMNTEQAKRYAAYLVEVLKERNLVWIVCGDDLFYDPGVVEFCNTIGGTIRRLDQLNRLITIHPSWIGGRFFQDQEWFDFIMVQSSHFDACQNLAYELVREEWALDPPRPIVNAEICYEEHTGFDYQHRFNRSDVRQAFWWSVLAGALGGVTYGANGVWQWITEKEQSESGASIQSALKLPGAGDLSLAKKILEDLQWWEFEPAQHLLLTRPARHIPVVINQNRDLLLAYVPSSMPPFEGRIHLKTDKLKRGLTAYWIDPETGTRNKAGAVSPESVLFIVQERKDMLLLLQ